jgi:poly-gamma-glutamate capsule biosynthesis protein CapA/YwtB (metallophosphatase superfamily)
MNILIGADICPIEGNQHYFEQGDAKSLFNDLLNEFEDADLVIANLECPLIETPSPILKTGPTFGAPGTCIKGIKQAGINVINLANNHIMDHGVAGLDNTLKACADAGISTVGAGCNVAEARRIFIKQIDTVRVAILAVAEHEFSIARNGSCGANPLDLIDLVRNISAHRKDFDYLIVLLHGGDEFHVPSPRIQNTCRLLVEIGANAVIVQHPHCLGGFENYRDGHIVYGQGALIMDEPIYRKMKSFHEGFLVKLLIKDDASSSMEIIPFVQSDPVPGARRMDLDREDEFRRTLDRKAKAVGNHEHVKAEWRKFCQNLKFDYLSAILGHNRVLRKLNGRGMLMRLFYSKRGLLGVRNVLLCETHREALETIFDDGLI